MIAINELSNYMHKIILMLMGGMVQEGLWFESQPGPFGVEFACLRGFPPGYSGFHPQFKDDGRLIGDNKLLVGMSV